MTLSGLKRTIIKYKFSIALWLFVTILLLLPLKTTGTGPLYLFPHQDKLIHIFLFFLLQKVILIEGKGNKFFQWALLLSVYGAFMEAVQHYFITNRTFSVMDILADILGILLGAAVYHFLYMRYF